MKSLEQIYRQKNIENMTPAELVVQDILTQYGFPFVSQRPIRNGKSFYIIDFYIKQPYKIAIEIDGWQHLNSRVNYDVKRTAFLECDKGIKVLRFRNDEVSKSPQFVNFLLAEIERARAIEFVDDLTFEYMGRFFEPWVGLNERI